MLHLAWEPTSGISPRNIGQRVLLFLCWRLVLFVLLFLPLVYSRPVLRRGWKNRYFFFFCFFFYFYFTFP